MSLRTLTIEITKPTGELITIVRLPKTDEFGRPYTMYALTGAARRYTKECIGYSGTIAVRVR